MSWDGSRPKRSLGQNFLVDRAVSARIVDAAGIAPGQTVLEIGPGRGALTEMLGRRAGRLVCVEKDEALAAELRVRFDATGNTCILQADALHLRPGELPVPPPYVVVGNLPYNVAGRITVHFIEEWAGAWTQATLMFQREVAERLAAQPGTRDYGALSVLVQSCCEVWTLFQVAPGSFRPRPKVQSSVVRLLPRGKPLWRTESGGGLDWPRFRAGVHAGFAARRKTIFNSLQVALPAREPAALRTALESAGIEPTLRAEAVPVAGWVRLASAL